MKKCFESDIAIAHLNSALRLLDQVGAAVTAAHVDAALGSAETELAPIRRPKRVESGKAAGHNHGRERSGRQRPHTGSYH